MNYIKQITKIGERLGKGEIEARKFIESVLKKNVIPYVIQTFPNSIPIQEKAILKADDTSIPCKGTSFVSGKISTEHILSNLISSQENIQTSNINFNPLSDHISCSNFYFTPSVAIAKKDIPKLMKAKKNEGSVKVKKYNYTSANILVGNIINPQNIIIAHYDSIETGSIDNASGVSLLLSLLTQSPRIRDKNLFVFSGSEELSYDYPIYWGKGFRELENKNKALFKKAENIYVVDCIGQTKPKLYTDNHFISLAFPIGKYEEKTVIVSGEFKPLMSIYHSKGDVAKLIMKRYYDQALMIMRNKLN